MLGIEAAPPCAACPSPLSNRRCAASRSISWRWEAWPTQSSSSMASAVRPSACMAWLMARHQAERPLLHASGWHVLQPHAAGLASTPHTLEVCTAEGRQPCVGGEHSIVCRGRLRGRACRGALRQPPCTPATCPPRQLA